MRCSHIQRRVREGSKCTSWPTFCVTWNSRTPSLIMSLRSRPHYAAEIWRRSFISSVRPTVHTSPSRKQSFPKTLFKPEEFENTGFAFPCGQKTFWKRSFSKTMTSRQSCNFPDRVLLNQKSKWPMIAAFSILSGVVWMKNNWYVLRVKTPFSNFSARERTSLYITSQTNVTIYTYPAACYKTLRCLRLLD